MTRALYMLMGFYIIAHSFVLSQYIPTPKPSETVKLLAASQWFIPTLLLAVLTPRLRELLTPITKVRFWTIIGLCAVVVCVTLQLSGIPGLWWSWSTMGLLILVVILVANASASKLGQVNAWLLGVMAMLLGMACWESLYQTGLLIYHNFFGSGIVCYYIVIAEQLTWIFPSLIVILVLHKRYGNIVRVSRTTLLCVWVSIILTAIWFVGGMEIPLLWYQGPEGIVGPIVNVMAEPYMISVSRGSQSFWLWGIASLFLPKGEHNEERGTLREAH